MSSSSSTAVKNFSYITLFFTGTEMRSTSGLRFEVTVPATVDSLVLRKLMFKGVNPIHEGDLFYLSCDDVVNVNYYNLRNTNPNPNTTPPYLTTVKTLPLFIKDISTPNGVMYHEFYNDYYVIFGNYSGGKIVLSNFVLKTQAGIIPQFTDGYIQMELVFKDNNYLPSPYTDTKFLLSRQQGGY